MRSLRLDINPQPNDTTCGPTCLHAVYRYYGDRLSLGRVIDEVKPLDSGGTLAVLLALHALGRGYDATIYTNNLQVFDPTWFVSGVDLAEKLRAQAARKRDKKLRAATKAYLNFLDLGGRVLFRDLNSQLIRTHLRKREPILTGLSATYLYGCARESDDDYDDVGGSPIGHFVLLSGYDKRTKRVRVADPLLDNPRFRSQYYAVDVSRVVAAILLGIVTYDANLLVVTRRTP